MKQMQKSSWRAVSRYPASQCQVPRHPATLPFPFDGGGAMMSLSSAQATAFQAHVMLTMPFQSLRCFKVQRAFVPSPLWFRFCHVMQQRPHKETTHPPLPHTCFHPDRLTGIWQMLYHTAPPAVVLGTGKQKPRLLCWLHLRKCQELSCLQRHSADTLQTLCRHSADAVEEQQLSNSGAG